MKNLIEKESGKSITINGIIIPSQWDTHGNIKGIAIAGFDEINYFIRMDKIGKGLMALMHEEVIVTGNVTKTNNSEVIKVVKYQPAKNP